ncbi:hypothetical protein BDZ94DRAFT_1241564 [Collybia nuda]|uniref:Uncharacterized protein n=1 Tax=Collybia nuda TaxID=64659 RepID=A0A9P5XTG2_9AGAR|nr:hypothetical protein BDZ94DRAFT_1241564 [Collybia nuda]
MTPHNHTTPEQLAWLMSLKPEFLEQQNKKKLADFWVKLDLGWFTHWPEPGVAEAELEPEGHPLQINAAKALFLANVVDGEQTKAWEGGGLLSKRGRFSEGTPTAPNSN